MAEDQDDAKRYPGIVPVSGVPGWCERFIGIPYKDDGHDFSGCNCFGLVHLVLKHRCGVAVEPEADVSASDVESATNRALSVAGNEPWHPVIGTPRVFDVALLRGRPLHCGIMVDSGLLLHVWRSPSSMAMSIDNPRIRTRIISYYRHADLA